MITADHGRFTKQTAMAGYYNAILDLDTNVRITCYEHSPTAAEIRVYDKELHKAEPPYKH